MAPVSAARVVEVPRPKMSLSANSRGEISVSHREYIRDIPGSVAFANTQFNLNPGLQAVFRWLSSLAPGYESYVFMKLDFYFETMKSTATSGTIMLACDYDSTDAAPANKQQLMSFAGAVRSPVWGECSLHLSHKEMYKQGPSKSIRLGGIPANDDIRLYDVGNLNVATDGCADTTALGELYAEYTVIFQTPQIDQQAVTNSLSGKIVGATGITRAVPFGTAPVVTGGLPVTAASATLTFNRVGTYLLSFQVTGTTFTGDPVYTGTAATAVLDAFSVDSGTVIMHNWATVSVTEIGQTVIVVYTTVAATVSACTLRITSYDNSLA